jgi:hypothetical protein
VEYGGRLYAGESVRETSYHWPQEWLPSEGGLAIRGRGEATVVSLPGGRLLVALTRAFHPKSQEPAGRPWEGNFIIGRQYGSGDDEWRQGRNKQLEGLARLRSGAPVAVAYADLPILLTFRDNRDPTSLIVVDPNDVSAAIPGARLASATVEPTDSPLFTEQIEVRLPWVATLLRNHARLNGDAGSAVSAAAPLTGLLGGSDFKLGFNS